jgi:hypothetical protein
MSKKWIIVVQQETLRERPRIRKLCKILESLNLQFEVWKFGDQQSDEILGMRIRNLLGAGWRTRPAVVRYAVWMVAVFVNAFRERLTALFFAVGFDSAAPITALSIQRPAMIFDNIDNVSLSYRWSYGFAWVFRALESWVAWRAQIHVVPSRARWSRVDRNLRVVANTPSREALSEAKAIAEQHSYQRGADLTVYLNGWLPETRGIQTLISALGLVHEKGIRVRVLVAGRPSCESANRLIAMRCSENLGMLTNPEALAQYYRSDLAFIYYDPSIAINRVAESQKWTDCWATNTAFITNEEVETLRKYVRQGACLTLPYHDSVALASLLESLSRDRSPLERVRTNLQKMEFRFWDEEMKSVISEWSEMNAAK